jgi:hypothetical protein
MAGYPSAPPSFGGYGGASFRFLSGELQPRVSAGLPVFFSNGARFSARVAGGIEYATSRHLALTLELGFESELNPESDIRRIAVVPAVAATGRL